MTRAELRAAIKAAHPRNDKDDNINTLINLAIKEIARRHDWNCLVTNLVSGFGNGASSVDLPSGCLRAIKATIYVTSDLSNARPLPIYRKELILSKYPYPTQLTNGIPVCAYFEGSKFYFIPPTDRDMNLNLWYVKIPLQLTQDTHSLDLTDLDDCVIAYGTAEFYRMLQMYQDAQMWDFSFERKLASAIRADGRRLIEEHIMQDTDHLPSITSPWVDPFAGFGNVRR